MDDELERCRECGLPVLGLLAFECRPNWHALALSSAHAPDLQKISSSDRGGSWHGECLARRLDRERLTRLALAGIRPSFAGEEEWGVSTSKAGRKRYRLAFDVLCAWPRYGARSEIKETIPPQGFVRSFRTDAGADRLLVMPTPWHLDPLSRTEIELDELRRIEAYARAFVPSGTDRIVEYGVPISQPFDAWLAAADVPFVATPVFGPVRDG